MSLNYLSIDIETTSLNPNDNILEIGIVADDFTHKVFRYELEDYLKTLPVFHCYVRHEKYYGHPYALSLNSKILEQLAKAGNHSYAPDGTKVIDAPYVASHISHWLTENSIDRDKYDKYIAAGKNFAGFDHQWLKKLPNFEDRVPISHKVIDPAMFYFNPYKDKEVPSLQKCLDIAGYDTKVAHTAVEDALDVIRVLRHAWTKLEG